MRFDLQHDRCVAAVWVHNVQSSSTTVLCLRMSLQQMKRECNNYRIRA